MFTFVINFVPEFLRKALNFEKQKTPKNLSTLSLVRPTIFVTHLSSTKQGITIHNLGWMALIVLLLVISITVT